VAAQPGLLFSLQILRTEKMLTAPIFVRFERFVRVPIS
jgi:hypothetical protein